MKFDTPYHSAYNAELDLAPIDRFEADRIVAVRHDVRQPLPVEFSGVSCLYMEPPWKVGFGKFNERAGVKGGTFMQLFYMIGGMVAAQKVPTFWVMAAPMAAEAPPPTDAMPIKLNGMNAVILSWRESMDFLREAKVRSQHDVIDALATRYDSVGDPVCGYGLTGSVFLKHGKRCVLSDYNGKCIAYIRDHYPEWTSQPSNTP